MLLLQRRALAGCVAGAASRPLPTPTPTLGGACGRRRAPAFAATSVRGASSARVAPAAPAAAPTPTSSSTSSKAAAASSALLSLLLPYALPLAALAASSPADAAAAADPAAAAAAADAALSQLPAAQIEAVLRPLITAATLLCIVRIPMTWYPSLDGTKLPWSLAFAPTEFFLKPTRAVVPPVGGVDVTPIVWVAVLSFASEILLGPQGLLILVQRQQAAIGGMGGGMGGGPI